MEESDHLISIKWPYLSTKLELRRKLSPWLLILTHLFHLSACCSQNLEFLPHDTNNGGEACIVGWLHGKRIGCLIPGADVGGLFRGFAGIGIDTDRKTEDADAATTARGLVELFIDCGRSIRTDCDLVAHSCGENKLRRSHKGLELFGSSLLQLVFRNVEIPKTGNDQ